MTIMYGVMAAMPMMWGYAGYVLVSLSRHRGGRCVTEAAESNSAARGLTSPTAGLELLEPAQDSAEWYRRGQAVSEAALKRAGIRHNDVARAVIAPLCGLVDHFVRGAAQKHFPHDRWRIFSCMRQCCLFVKGVRHQLPPACARPQHSTPPSIPPSQSRPCLTISRRGAASALGW